MFQFHNTKTDSQKLRSLAKWFDTIKQLDWVDTDVQDDLIRIAKSIEERKCLLKDESAHWYCVPVELKDQFQNHYLIDNPNTLNTDFVDIQKYELGCNISLYSFTDFKKINE